VMVAELQEVTRLSRADRDIVAAILRALPATLIDTQFTLADLEDHFRAQGKPLPASAKSLGKAFAKYSGVVIDGATISGARKGGQNCWIVHRVKPSGPRMLIL